MNDVLTAAGWKIGKGQISSSNGNAILSGSGVLSLGSGTHDYDQANRIYIDPNTDGGRMSIGRGFKYTGDALTVGGWTINNTTITGGQVTLNSSGIISVGNLINASTTLTEKYGFIADSSGNVLIKGDDSDTNYIKFDVDGEGSALQIKTANFEVVGGNVTMAGTVTANAGQIGGFTIANNQLTGSGTALIATNTGTDRIEIRSADNTLVFLEGTKNLASPIFFLGKTAGDPSGLGTGTTSNINRYGPRASGSTGAISNQNNLGQFRVQNPDIMAGNGMSAVGLPGRFYYQYSNVWSTLDMGTSAGSISGLKGRASIWGETRQASPTAGSQNTSGLLVGVGGAHHDNNLSYRWNLSTGLLGVSSPHYANFTSANLPTGSGVPITSAYSEGSYGLVSLGDVYSTGSFVLRDGPLVVSASTDGEFGGGESGVIIDSSNVASKEAALTFKNDAQTFIMGVDDDDVFKIYDGTSLPSGNTTNQSICITSAFMYLTAGSILLQGGYTSTGSNCKWYWRYIRCWVCYI